jgi:hypothetical protein
VTPERQAANVYRIVTFAVGKRPWLIHAVKIGNHKTGGLICGPRSPYVATVRSHVAIDASLRISGRKKRLSFHKTCTAQFARKAPYECKTNHRDKPN